MKFYVKYYDLSLNDEPEKPDWQGIAHVSLTYNLVHITSKEFARHFFCPSTIIGGTFQPKNTMVIWGYEKFDNVYHYIKLELENANSDTANQE